MRIRKLKNLGSSPWDISGVGYMAPLTSGQELDIAKIPDPVLVHVLQVGQLALSSQHVILVDTSGDHTQLQTIQDNEFGSITKLMSESASGLSEVLLVDSTASTDIHLDGFSIHSFGTANYFQEYDNGTFSAAGASINIDWNNGNRQMVTMDASITDVTFTDPPSPCNLLLKVVQSGSGPYTVTNWPANVSWANQTPIGFTSGNGSIDIIAMYYDGSAYYTVPSNDFG